MSRKAINTNDNVVLVDSADSSPTNGIVLDIARDVSFDVEPVRRYALACWDPIIWDLMVVAAAVEFADRVVSRKKSQWRRHLFLRVPVQDPQTWNADGVVRSLCSALGLLTGDNWSFSFVGRKTALDPHSIVYLNLYLPTAAVMAYSDGLDSLAVAEIVRSQLEEELLFVRVQRGAAKPGKKGESFESVSYRIDYRGRRKKESSCRSRTFKFIVICAVAAYMARTKRIIVPESGQSSLGSALLPLGQLYPHYGSHPVFTNRMELFLNKLLGTEIHIEIPRLWNTKGQTLAEYVALCPAGKWNATKSCWKPNYLSSVNGRSRDCGICAACMLRRLSIRVAGIKEADGTYLSDDLNVSNLLNSVPPAFRSSRAYGRAFRADAVAGTKSMSDLANMAQVGYRHRLRPYALDLSRVLELSADEVYDRLSALICQHESEWSAFLGSLHPNSFVRKWAT